MLSAGPRCVGTSVDYLVTQPYILPFTFTFTFSHLADAFVQSDLQGCIHIFYIYTDGTPHQEQLGVQCLAQGRFDRESN